MKTFFSVLVLTLIVMGGLPQSTLAYKTTSQSTRQYGDTTALFQITYRFGFLNRELYMPVSALRGVATTTRDAIGYVVLDKNGKVVTTGTMTGLVLSSAAIKNGQYYLPAGKAADFTFTGVFTVPADTELSDYRVLMTSLPFVMVDKGKNINAQLNPSELQYYITPTAGMNAKQFGNGNVRVSGITYTLKTK